MKKYIYSTCLLLLTTFSSVLAQGGYGEALYPHYNGGTKMSSAFTSKLHINNPGYLMAGFQATSVPSTYNFMIDRTDQSGLISNNAWVFQLGYKVFADVTEGCEYKPSQIYNCVGVSVIETDGSSNSPYNAQNPIRYALAGAFNSGSFFTLLGQNGHPLFSTSFIFPTKPASIVTKPIIVECPKSPGEYIVSGSFDKIMYAYRIDVLGNVLWSKLYPIQGEPRDMIVSPYGTNPNSELFVVGRTEIAFALTGVDGFVLNLDMATGNVNTFERTHCTAHVNFGLNYFNAISLSPGVFSWSRGFMIGGFTQPLNPNYPNVALMMRTDTSGTFMDVLSVISANDSINGEVMDVTVRKRLNSAVSDYYFLMQSTFGMRVLKLNTNVPVNSPAASSEAFYTIPGKIASSCAIDFVEDPSQPDAGIQAFGTDDGNILSSHYAVRTYFSGESGCSYSPVQPYFTNPPPFFIQHTIVPSAGLNACRNFYINCEKDGGSEQLCGPYVSIAGASNARTVGFEDQTEFIPLQAKVVPNPAVDQAKLEFETYEKGLVHIELYNNLGQSIQTLVHEQKDAGQYNIDLQLHDLDLKAGIYFVRLNLNGANQSLKFIFNGN